MDKPEVKCALEQLLAIEDFAKRHKVPIICQSGAGLLQDLVAMRKPRMVLEIGTAIGYSALVMAVQLPLGAQLITIEQDANRATIAERFWEEAGVQHQITLLRGDAKQVIPALSEVFDFVFIDAAKGQYPDYLTALLPKLSPGAVVVADNVLFRGLVEKEEVPRRYRTIVRRLRDYLCLVDDPNLFTTDVMRIGDGIAVSYYQGGTGCA